jgi:O-antigen ligase
MYKNDKINKAVLFLIAFCIPFYNLNIYHRSPIYFIFILIIFLMFTGFVNIRKKYPLEMIVIILLSLYKLLSIIWSIDPISSKYVAVYSSIPILILVIFFFNLVKDIHDLNFLLKVYVLSCLIFSIFVLLNFYYKPQNLVSNLDNTRFTFLDTNPNEVSFFMLYGIIILFYLNSIKRFNKLIVNFFIIIFIITILLTGSRTGLVILFLVLILFLINKRSFYWSLSFFVVTFLILYLFKDQLGDEVILRFTNLLKIFSDHPDFYREGYRGWVAEKGLSNFFNESVFYQIFGIGYESFGKFMYENTRISISHHNQILGYLIELGFFGLIINLILFVLIFKKVIKLSKKYSFVFFLFIIPIYSYMFTAGFDAKFFFYFFIVIILKFYEFLMLQKTNN